MEADDPVSGLTKEIQEVVDEIRAAQNQLKQNTDPKEKEWLRGQIQCLWRREEFLRDEKKTLLEKQLPNSAVTKAAFQHACGISISSKWRQIAALPSTESEYKARFPSARSPVCSLRENPCILWEGVGSGLVELDKRILEKLSPSHITVLLAPSGSGKTRMLIELACQRFTLFFTGGKPTTGFGGGSNDVNTVVKWMLKRLAGQDNIDPDHIVVRFGVGLLIYARLVYLKIMKLHRPGLLPKEWAFFQLEYPMVEDVFEALVDSFLGLVGNAEIDRPLLDILTELIWEAAKEVEWKQGVVVLDEAQLLVPMMQGRFTSTRTPKTGQSVLNPVILALKKFGVLQCPVFVSGTGTSMLRVRENLVTGTMKPFDVGEVYSLPGFNEMNIEKFLARFIDVTGLDMPAVISTYTGRRRLLSTAIEKYIVTINPPSDWFHSFSLDMIIKTGSELGVHRSLGDDAELLWSNPETAPFIKDVLCTYYLTGAGQVILPRKKRAMLLVDCGFATLLESDHGAGPFSSIMPHIQDVMEDEKCEYAGTKNVGYVILHEPLIVAALWHHMPSGTLMERFIDNSLGDASVCGISFERYACLVGNTFRNREPATVLGLEGTDEVYKEVYELVEPRGTSPVLVQKIENEGQFDKWVEAVETGVSFATYAWIGPFQEAGLDGMFLLRSKKSKKMMPVLLQFRTGCKLGATQSFATLDIIEFLQSLHSGGITASKLKAWCSNGHVRLALTPHPRPRLGTVAFGDLRQSERLKDKKQVGMVSPLSAVWAGRRLRGIVNPELFDAVEEVRRELKKQKTG